MESALGWLGALIEWFGQFFPRWTIVNTTEAGVKWITRWRRTSRWTWVSYIEVQAFGPGMQFHWPVRTELLKHPVARQTLDLRPQTLSTADDKPILAGGLISYRIHDIEKALAHTEHIDSTIRDAALSAIHSVITKMTWSELKAAEQSEELDKKLRLAARRVLEPYGVRVIKMSITDLAPTRVIKLAMSSDTII